MPNSLENGQLQPAAMCCRLEAEASNLVMRLFRGLASILS
jgi:hypothetical protein